MQVVKSIKEQKNSFAIRFIVLFLSLNLPIILLPDSVHKAVNMASAKILAVVLGLFSYQAHVSKEVVSIPGFSVQIIPECTGIHAALLFVCFVLAYNAPAKAKALGLLYGVPGLLAFNFLRLAGITIFGAYQPELFEYLHIFVAQALVIAVVFAACLVWLAYYAPSIRKSNLPVFLFRLFGLLGLLFLVWALGNGWYVQFVELFARAFLPQSGPYQGPYTYGPFYDPKTFNLVTFAALVLATSDIDRNRKLWGLAIGICVLTANHVLLRIAEQLFTSFGKESAKYPAILLNFIGQLFLPLFIWAIIAKQKLFRKQGIFTCPICGEEKFGIIQHVIAKHGQDVLKLPEIRENLSRQGVNLSDSS